MFFVSKFITVSQDPSRTEYPIKNTEALQINALLALNMSNGKTEFMDDAASLLPTGLIIASNPGNTGDELTGNTAGTYKSVSRGNLTLKNVSVTGVTALTDVGKLVYATDGHTLTLTRPTTGLPIGVIVAYVSTTYVDIHVFDFVQSWILSMASSAPTAYFRKSIGFFPTNAIQGTNAADLRVETSYEHYKILSLHAIPTSYDNALVAGAQDLNLEIGTTNVTGGVLSLAYTSFDATGDMGTVINATAITAENEVHIGDVVTLELVASGTGMTADMHGAFEVFSICERLPGA